MIRKILLFIVLMCVAFPANAQSDKYCFSSTKISEMWALSTGQNQDADTRRALGNLFDYMFANNEPDSISGAGCVTTTSLAEICKNIWGDSTEKCRIFLNTITADTTKQNQYKTQVYSEQLTRTEFDTIDPTAFSRAFDRMLARRRDKQIPSKLQDMAPVFLAQAQQEQINPFIAAAISMYESGHGTSRVARTKNNIAGLVGAKGYITFATVPDSIAKETQTLRKWIATKDLRGLAYSGHYCAKHVATAWHRDVGSIAGRLYNYYNEYVEKSE